MTPATQRPDQAWAFLERYLTHADAFVFSREEYVPDWVEQERLVVIAPSIDPFSAKNRELDPQRSARSSPPQAWSPAPHPGGPVRFQHRDGSRGTVRHHTDLIADGPRPPRDVRLVRQVSRWDRLKDMAGVLTGFVKMAAEGPDDAHLMLVGPDVYGVTDDPEGADVLAECRALQRHAYLVVQKMLVEGFGLTVTEAMWKARPMIASRVGGIQDQIVHERESC